MDGLVCRHELESLDGSYWSPVQTRPRLLTGSCVLRGAGEPHGGADAVRRVPPSSARRCGRPRQVPLASPSSGSPAPRARTGGPVLPASALYGSARRSAAGTPAGTADGSSASWTFLSAPTMGCPRNRVNSTLSSPEQAIEGLAGPRIVSAALGRRRLEHAELALLFDCACVAELELYNKDRNL